MKKNKTEEIEFIIDENNRVDFRQVLQMINMYEEKIQKKQAIFDKAIEYIKERFYFNEETGEYSLLHTIDKDNIKELLDILNEVSEWMKNISQ